MVECPDPDCRESILRKINDEYSQIGKCLNSKVSVSILTWALIAMLSAVGIIAGISYNAYSRGQDEKQKQLDNCHEATKNLDKAIGIIQNDIKNIKEALLEQKKNTKESFEKQERQQNHIIRMLDRIEQKTNGGKNDTN